LSEEGEWISGVRGQGRGGIPERDALGTVCCGTPQPRWKRGRVCPPDGLGQNVPAMGRVGAPGNAPAACSGTEISRSGFRMAGAEHRQSRPTFFGDAAARGRIGWRGPKTWCGVSELWVLKPMDERASRGKCGQGEMRAGGYRSGTLRARPAAGRRSHRLGCPSHGGRIHKSGRTRRSRPTFCGR